MEVVWIGLAVIVAIFIFPPIVVSAYERHRRKRQRALSKRNKEKLRLGLRRERDNHR